MNPPGTRGRNLNRNLAGTFLSRNWCIARPMKPHKCQQYMYCIQRPMPRRNGLPYTFRWPPKEMPFRKISQACMLDNLTSQREIETCRQRNWSNLKMIVVRCICLLNTLHILSHSLLSRCTCPLYSWCKLTIPSLIETCPPNRSYRKKPLSMNRSPPNS